MSANWNFKNEGDLINKRYMVQKEIFDITENIIATEFQISLEQLKSESRQTPMPDARCVLFAVINKVIGNEVSQKFIANWHRPGFGRENISYYVKRFNDRVEYEPLLELRSARVAEELADRLKFNNKVLAL